MVTAARAERFPGLVERSDARARAGGGLNESPRGPRRPDRPDQPVLADDVHRSPRRRRGIRDRFARLSGRARGGPGGARAGRLSSLRTARHPRGLGPLARPARVPAGRRWAAARAPRSAWRPSRAQAQRELREFDEEHYVDDRKPLRARRHPVAARSPGVWRSGRATARSSCIRRTVIPRTGPRSSSRGCALSCAATTCRRSRSRGFRRTDRSRPIGQRSSAFGRWSRAPTRSCPGMAGRSSERTQFGC